MGLQLAIQSVSGNIDVPDTRSATSRVVYRRTITAYLDYINTIKDNIAVRHIGNNNVTGIYSTNGGEQHKNEKTTSEVGDDDSVIAGTGKREGKRLYIWCTTCRVEWHHISECPIGAVQVNPIQKHHTKLC